jgi:nucleotide-binding universal stress UspA family protein
VPTPRLIDQLAEPAPVFDRILVGIDETAESLLATVQAGVLRTSGGRLVLVGVAERYLASHAGLAAGDADGQLVAGTLDDLARAQALVDADESVMASGRLVPVLCAEARRRRATLVAIGARPHGRLEARTLGGHDTEALAKAPCSVLIARAGWGPHLPDRVVVAVDGSAASRTAEAAARALALRLDRDLLPVVALGEPVDLGVLRAERGDALLDVGPLVDAVARAATRASLVVVGRDRGALPRSRSRVERMVCKLRCSVLVVDGGLEPDRGGA